MTGQGDLQARANRPHSAQNPEEYLDTQVAIIGGGPSGLLLSQLLHVSGISSIVLERRSKDHVLSRIRAGVLEQGLLGLMRQAGVADRMEREGFTHKGTVIAYDATHFRIDFTAHTDTPVMVYGQTEVTRDLYDAREASGADLRFDVDEVQITDAGPGPGAGPARVSYVQNGQRRDITADFVAGCDGFHGVSRQTIPKYIRREYEKVYPFGWLGILSETPPVHHELIYANSSRGFALCSMRNATLSRYYIQCDTSDHAGNWSDDAFWDELRRRVPAEFADTMVTGPSIEKSIAPLRSFVCEPMRWGQLFLCGDAAHIVPPTGAKGLNTAASDVHYLWTGLRDHYSGDGAALDAYSARALARVWKAERFSWWMTSTLHRFPDQTGFDLRMQHAELAFLQSSQSAQAALAQNYVGLPY